jgi:1-acyl-sn-glycerol-3-phosphate acyltransferase
VSAKPTYDVSERDPDFIRRTLPLVRIFGEWWHRSEVHGLEATDRLPSVLYVGNHSGGFTTPDAPILALALMARHGVDWPIFLLAHDMLFLVPGAGALRRWGIMPASRANAMAALRAGGSVIVFPGGDHDVFRPSSEQARIDLAGRTGFIDTALVAGVPIVPFVSIGGQETQLFLTRGEWLARLNPATSWARTRVWPISLGFPFGISVGGFPPNLPLPAKITTRVLAPIDVRARFGANPDRQVVYSHVSRVLQEALDELAAERRFPVVG